MTSIMKSFVQTSLKVSGASSDSDCDSLVSDESETWGEKKAIVSSPSLKQRTSATISNNFAKFKHIASVITGRNRREDTCGRRSSSRSSVVSVVSTKPTFLLDKLEAQRGIGQSEIGSTKQVANSEVLDISSKLEERLGLDVPEGVSQCSQEQIGSQAFSNARTEVPPKSAAAENRNTSGSELRISTCDDLISRVLQKPSVLDMKKELLHKLVDMKDSNNTSKRNEETKFIWKFQDILLREAWSACQCELASLRNDVSELKKSLADVESRSRQMQTASLRECAALRDQIRKVPDGTKDALEKAWSVKAETYLDADTRELVRCAVSETVKQLCTDASLGQNTGLHSMINEFMVDERRKMEDREALIRSNFKSKIEDLKLSSMEEILQLTEEKKSIQKHAELVECQVTKLSKEVSELKKIRLPEPTAQERAEDHIFDESQQDGHVSAKIAQRRGTFAVVPKHEAADPISGCEEDETTSYCSFGEFDTEADFDPNDCCLGDLDNEPSSSSSLTLVQKVDDDIGPVSASSCLLDATRTLQKAVSDETGQPTSSYLPYHPLSSDTPKLEKREVRPALPGASAATLLERTVSIHDKFLANRYAGSDDVVEIMLSIGKMCKQIDVEVLRDAADMCSGKLDGGPDGAFFLLIERVQSTRCESDALRNLSILLFEAIRESNLRKTTRLDFSPEGKMRPHVSQVVTGVCDTFERMRSALGTIERERSTKQQLAPYPVENVSATCLEHIISGKTSEQVARCESDESTDQVARHRSDKCRKLTLELDHGTFGENASCFSKAFTFPATKGLVSEPQESFQKRKYTIPLGDLSLKKKSVGTSWNPVTMDGNFAALPALQTEPLSPVLGQARKDRRLPTGSNSARAPGKSWRALADQPISPPSSRKVEVAGLWGEGQNVTSFDSSVGSISSRQFPGDDATYLSEGHPKLAPLQGTASGFSSEGNVVYQKKESIRDRVRNAIGRKP